MNYKNKRVYREIWTMGFHNFKFVNPLYYYLLLHFPLFASFSTFRKFVRFKPSLLLLNFLLLKRTVTFFSFGQMLLCYLCIRLTIIFEYLFTNLQLHSVLVSLENAKTKVQASGNIYRVAFMSGRSNL